MLRKIKKIEKIQLVNNPQDIIHMDAPLTIHLLQYVRDTANTSLDLPKIVQTLVDHSRTHVVTMSCYYDIIGQTEEPALLTEKSTLFRMDSRTLWSAFGWGPLNYSIALNNNIEGLPEIENRIYGYATRIGDFVSPYYGVEISKTLGDALTQFSRIGISVIKDLKNGIPLDGTKARWDASVENIASFLSAINPDYWPKEPVKSYFDALVNLWIDSIRAREVKDFAANEVAISAIEKLITMGTNDTPSLADAFSNGIISQFPEKFID